MITFYQHIEEIKKAYKITDAEQIASLKTHRLVLLLARPTVKH